MSNIFYKTPELVIALNKIVIFVNPDDLQIFKEIVVPDELKITNNSIANGELQDKETKQKYLSKDQPIIQNVKMSPNHQLLAVTTMGQKALLLYKLRPEHAELVSVRALARASSALTFSGDSKRLLVTDKTGDCYEYDCEKYDAAPKFLFGHLSIVYDIIWSSDEKYIITCDRDNKIRVTNYPATYDIHSYCLGHKEFVSTLELINHDVLLSTSGDGTLKLWDFKAGKELKSMTLPAPGIRCSVKCLESGKYEIAVLLYQPNECVAICELTYTENSKQWHFSTPQLLRFGDMICCSLCYAHDRLYVTGIKNDHFVIKLSENSPDPPLNWLQVVEEQFKKCNWTPEDISAWFKKKYDNVSDYLERKKRRIEEKH